MKAGRELDDLIAYEFFDMEKGCTSLWSPSRNFENAFEVVKRIEQMNEYVRMKFEKEMQKHSIYKITPRLICLSALKAKRSGGEQLEIII